jgi:hypothetical protein
MILRLYGTSVQSVEPDFDAHALTEIAFRRTGELSIPVDEFTQEYERVREEQLTARSEGAVKDEAEQQLLASLLDQLDHIRSGLGASEVVLIENERGQDDPKTRDRTSTSEEPGAGRLYFHWHVDPPLRLGIYRKKES